MSDRLILVGIGHFQQTQHINTSQQVPVLYYTSPSQKVTMNSFIYKRQHLYLHISSVSINDKETRISRGIFHE